MAWPTLAPIKRPGFSVTFLTSLHAPLHFATPTSVLRPFLYFLRLHTMHIPTRRSLIFWLAALATSLFANAATAPEPERTPARPQRSVVQDPASAQVIVKFRANSTLRQAQATRSPVRQDNAPQHAAALSTRLRLPLSDGRVLGRHTQSL